MGAGGGSTSAQKAQLRAEQLQAQKDAQEQELKNQQSVDARRRGMLGRRSLIGTSELGVSDYLGN